MAAPPNHPERRTAARAALSSERSVRVTFAIDVDPGPEAVGRVRRALTTPPIPGVTDIVPGVASIQILFDPLDTAPDLILGLVSRRLESAIDSSSPPEPRTLELPVCYDEPFAPDLEHVAARAGLSVPEAVELHASTTYTARFLGFSPGFAYLDGLPGPLHTPRLPSPRTRIEPGSVAIAGGQAGVYPQATPGGWRIIGRTPLWMFDPAHEPPSRLSPGDLVRFRPIGGAEFDRIASQPRTDER